VPGDELVKDGRELMQAVQVSPGQLLQDAVALAGQADPDDAAVVPVRRPFHQPGGLGPVDKLDRAVRPQEQVAGQITHGGRQVAAVPFDRDQQLMLDMSQARGSRLVLAPALEPAQRNAELEELLEILLAQLGCPHLRPSYGVALRIVLR